MGVVMERITVQDFKVRWAGVFKFQPYPNFDPKKVGGYAIDDKVYGIIEPAYIPTIYQSLKDSNTSPLEDNTAWNPTTDAVKGFVSDLMIEEAIIESSAFIKNNGQVFDDEYVMIVMLFAAHFLVYDWKMANQGMNSSGSSGILTHRTVGKMSAGYAINPMIVANPMLAPLLTTPFGQKAVMMWQRYWTGQVIFAQGSFTSY